MRQIAIIGTGISGLTAAHLLHAAGAAEVTLYEKNDYAGGHARTRTVDYDGQKIAVDTGFIVFNERNYPGLTALFKHLDIPTSKSDMSFGISVSNGAFEWGAGSLMALFGQPGNLVSPRFYGMLRDIGRFFRKAPQILNDGTDIELGAYLDRLGMGDAFRRYFLLPMGGAIWSCSPETMMRFPARSFVQFFQNHGLLTVSDQPQWYTVKGGAEQYIARLIAPFAHKIKLNCGIKRVSRTENDTLVESADGSTARYDQVIFACHGDQVLRLLADPTPQEKDVFGRFSYQENVAYLHRDIRQMPHRRRCWSAWNYLSGAEAASSHLAVTYWMNRLQPIPQDKPLFVTLNPIDSIPDELVFDVCKFEHPVFDAQSLAAQAQLPALQGQNRTWYCGAYQRYGFHEDGLQSALAIADKMGVRRPW